MPMILQGFVSKTLHRCINQPLDLKLKLINMNSLKGNFFMLSEREQDE